MDDLLDYQRAVESAIDWLETARAILARLSEESDGGWAEVGWAQGHAEEARVHLDQMLLVMRGDIAEAQADYDHGGDLAEAAGY